MEETETLCLLDQQSRGVDVDVARRFRIVR